MKGWFTSIRCSTDMILYNIIDIYVSYCNMYIHICIYVHGDSLRVYTYVYLYMYIYMHIHIYICIYIYIYIYIYILCVCVYTYICIYVYVYSGVERSERHRRGEASSLFFAFRFKRLRTFSEWFCRKCNRNMNIIDAQSMTEKYRWQWFSSEFSFTILTQRNSSRSRFYLDNRVIRDENHKSFVHVLQERVEESFVFHKFFARRKSNELNYF